MVTETDIHSFICFAVACVSELPGTVTAIRAVHRTWNVYVFKVAARLFFKLPYKLKLVCYRINYVPPLVRVNRILEATQGQNSFTWDGSNQWNFIELVNAQLLLQHLRSQRPSPHKLHMSDILTLFVNCVAEVLNHKHPFVREGIMATQYINLPYEYFVECNFSDDIPRMWRMMRGVAVVDFSLAAIVETLLRSYYLRCLGIADCDGV